MADCEVDYNCLCRLCATKITTILGFHIFESEGLARQLEAKVATLLPIQINVSDNLPKMVCQECVYKLEVFYEFREKSVHTEQILLTLLRELTTTEENVERSYNEISIHSTEETIENPILLQENISESRTIVQKLIVEEHVLSDETIDRDIMEERVTEIIDSSSTIEEETAGPQVTAYFSGIKTEHVKVEDVKDEVEAKTVGNEHKPPVYSSQYETQFDDDEPEGLFENPNHITENQLQEMFNSIEPQSTVAADGTQSVYFFCNFCTVAYRDKNEFVTHYRTHWVKCEQCSALFRDLASMKLHTKKQHPPHGKIKLDVKILPDMDYEPDDPDELDEGSNSDGEIKTTSGETSPKDDIDPKSKSKGRGWQPKVCKECGKQFRSNYKLNEHMRKHTGEQPFKCTSCTKGFRSKIGLAQHEATHTGIYEYSCPTCGKGFQCRSYLAVHQRVHSDAKPYQCVTCGRHFKTKQALLDHMNRHLGVKPFMCDICGRGFITKGLCKSHQKVHSGTDNRQYPCSVCHKMFVSKSYLTTHMRIHTGEKPFCCEVCGKGFLTRVDLRIHSTMHTGEKSFVCEMCGKAFARRDALRCHHRSHTGERPYRCDICGQSFTQFSPMAIHKRLHTGERPYECDVCFKPFVSRSTMVAHRRKHPKD